MASETYDIQRLVAESGVPRRTIHFYVQQGLLPPPQGAGLAATYGEEHRLRLALIPILRGQGLRLDDIRKRFAAMSLDAMRQLVAEEGRSAPMPTVPASALQPRGGLPLREPAPAPLDSARRFLHYSYPGGVSIVVPENLSPVERQRVERLLQAADKIFSPAFPVYAKHAPGETGPDNT